MSKVWDEAAIREEFVKLDKKTGLNGAASCGYYDPEMCRHYWDKIAMEKKSEQYAASSIN